MAALGVAAGFGALVFIAGAGWTRRTGDESPSPAFASAACLALLVVASVDIGSTSRFSLLSVIVVALAITLVGWIGGRTHPPGNSPDRRHEALVMGVVVLAMAALLLAIPVPFDTDAQGFGYLALAIRDGRSLSSLAPWHPEISYLYSPGVPLLFAAVSLIVPRVPMSSIMMGVASVAAVLFAWLAFDLGSELGLHGSAADRVPGRSRWRWSAGLSGVFAIGLWSAYMDAHYTAVFGLLFALGCVISALRLQRTGRASYALMGGLFLGAVAVSHPDMTIALAVGIASFILAPWLAADRSARGKSLAVSAIPLAAAVFVSPWLVSLRPLLASGVHSPFEVDSSHASILVVYHGVVGPIFALGGAILVIRRRISWGLAMVAWLLITIDISTVGLLERVFPALGASLFRFNYPFSLAWHGPILPYLALASAALVWVAEQWKHPDPGRYLSCLTSISAALIIAGFAFRHSLLDATREFFRFHGALASANDGLAMAWLRDHSDPGTRILNYPGDYERGRDWEAHWAPVISERDCVYFRWQPFFITKDDGDTLAEQRALLAFWQDPADPSGRRLLEQSGIEYVLVPESIGEPESLRRAWRWAPPAVLAETRSMPSDAPYLELAFSAGGAQVYRVLR
jgi:hypothetical protein